MRIRKFKIEDSAEAARLHRGTIRNINKSDYTSSQITAWSKKTSAESFRDSYELAVRYVAIEDGKIIGFCDFEKDEPENFWGLYVHKDHLGRGVGSKLLQKATEAAKKQGAKKFHLKATKTAKVFYEKQGFRVIKKIKHQIDDQKLDVYEMEKKL